MIISCFVEGEGGKVGLEHMCVCVARIRYYTPAHERTLSFRTNVD